MNQRNLPFIVLLVTITRSVTGMAQHSGIGLKGGPLLSETRSGAITTNLTPGATLGLYFPLRAGNRLELQPELLVTALGAGYTLPDGERSTVRTVYAQLPVSAKLYFSNVINVQAGVQLGYLLLAQQEDPDGSTTVTENYETMDLGLVIGAGADLISGCDISLRYYNGLKPILKDDTTYFPRNQAYMLTVGYRFARLRAPKFERRRS